MEGSCQGVLAALVIMAGLAGRSREPGGMSHGFHVEGEEGTQGGPALAGVVPGDVPRLLPPRALPSGGSSRGGPLPAPGAALQVQRTPSSLHRGSRLLAWSPRYLSTAIIPVEIPVPLVFLMGLAQGVGRHGLGVSPARVPRHTLPRRAEVCGPRGLRAAKVVPRALCGSVCGQAIAQVCCLVSGWSLLSSGRSVWGGGGWF